MTDSNTTAVQTVVEYVKVHCKTGNDRLSVLGCSLAAVMITMEATRVSLVCADGMSVDITLNVDEDYDDEI